VDIELRHTPAFGVAHVDLADGEEVQVEAGAMMATSADVDVEAKMEGGVLKSLRRGVLGGESIFMTTYTGPGWVDVAARLPGDVRVLDVTADRPFVLDRGSFLAADGGVDIDSKWKGLKSLVGGEGGFMVHATGQGKLIVSSYGAMDHITLDAGERIIVDTGHMIAFPDDMEWKMRRAASGRSLTSAKTGEFLVFEFVGPGEILTQSRNERSLLQWIETEIGGKE
jgi:uncharacterized protein (TIGR00266 family)